MVFGTRVPHLLRTLNKPALLPSAPVSQILAFKAEPEFDMKTVRRETAETTKAGCHNPSGTGHRSTRRAWRLQCSEDSEARGMEAEVMGHSLEARLKGSHSQMEKINESRITHLTVTNSHIAQ